MFVTEQITVAKNTTEANPSVTTIQLTKGIMTKWSFKPRPFHAGLCHARVFYHEHQIIPHNLDADLHGDTFPIESEEYQELLSAPYKLKVKAWNDDDTYPHTFDISFTILAKKDTLAGAVAKAFSEALGSLFGRPVASEV